MVEDQQDDVTQRMCQGDSDAFKTILDRHMNPILAYVRRFLPLAPAADVEDIAQETFLRLWNARRSYDPERVKVSTWLHRIAHNLCVDQLRRQQPGPQTEEEPVGCGPEKTLESAEQTRQLQRALMTLGERQRSALVLCHYQGFSNKEAANILDISVDALESLLRRGRSKLKETLLQHEGLHHHE